MYKCSIQESFVGSGQIHKSSGETNCPAAIAMFDYLDHSHLITPES